MKAQAGEQYVPGGIRAGSCRTDSFLVDFQGLKDREAKGGGRAGDLLHHRGLERIGQGYH